jgi:uncharacterized protein YkwD
MRTWRVATTAFVALMVSVSSAHACGWTHVKLDPTNAAKVSRATVCLLNRQRAHHGLHKLRSSTKLRTAATTHSQDMVAEGYFEHDGPNGDTLISRAQQVGYLSHVRSWSLAENIGYGDGSNGTAAGIVHAWMHSPGHRANILTPTSRDAGVGIAQGEPSGDGGATYTLDLGYAR